MLPFPFGVAGDEVIDPDGLADEFLEFARTAGRLTHWQWRTGAFTDQGLLVPRQSVYVMNKQAWGNLQTVSTVDPILTASLGAVDAGIWQIPYNRGFSEIGDGDVTHEWTSEYPELVISAFSFQYIRVDVTDFDGYDPADPLTHLHPRAQVQMAFDGARVDGSGPYAKPFDTRYRGTGLGQRSVRTTVVTIQGLPAGSHSVQPMAAQQPALKVEGDNNADATIYIDNPPVEGVCIGSRRHILIRCARGKLLRA